MNTLIKQQLDKVRNVSLPPYDDNTTLLVIPKGGVEIHDFEVGHYYTIYIEDCLINKCDWFDTIHNNWNNGIAPTSNKMNVQICQTMGNMIRVDGTCINDCKVWTGWLPKKNCKIIEEIQ